MITFSIFVLITFSLTLISCTTVRLCNNNGKVITCPGGTNLTILCANYGRTSADICSIDNNISCWHPMSIVMVEYNMCSGGGRYCSLSASVNSFIFDPCPGTDKYLEVTYLCTSSDGSNLVPHCGANEIEIPVNPAGIPNCIFSTQNITTFCVCKDGFAPDPYTGVCTSI